MAFRRPHLRQRRTCEEYKAKLEEKNYHLHSELQTEVDLNCQNESRINQLERDYPEEEMVELKSEISSLKSRLYQAKKDVRDKEKYISDLEKCLEESEEQVDRLRCRIKAISS
ncbi:hypothetical protein RclHR1_04650020 [Rhizophagus clarus]|uniref:Uncharacterized protein n=1 Tax=Rhizophagus clarus TaxID=94130 RepID=A0A2Z6RNI6_9GLOM|nr:hypothetical protein RclHR1_04650020 [Rhizophagus clarus]